MNVKVCLPVITLLLLLPLAAVAAAPGAIGISAEITSAEVAFEAKDTLTVRLTWEGEPFLYQIDDFPMPELDKLRILGSSSSVSRKKDSVSGGDITARVLTYILQPTDYGTGVVKPLSLNATNKASGEVHQLITGQLTVEIAKPVPREPDGGSSGLVTLLIIGGAAVLAAAAAVFIIRKRRADRNRIPVGDSSYVEMLAEMRKETVADGKLFYSRLYRLLIAYLEKERALDLTGKTAEEVIRALDTLDDEDSDKAPLRGWLERLQIEKYRPEAPTRDDVDGLHAAVHQFFEKKLCK